MALASLISEKLIQEYIVSAVTNVCTMMLRQEAGFVAKTAESAYAGFTEKPHVFGSVGFSGDIDGTVFLCIPETFAQVAASSALGMTPAEVADSGDETVNDVVGEITNMIVGNFKNALCNAGFPCRLTVPAIIRGNDLVVASMKDSERHIFHFNCEQHHLVLDVQLRHEPTRG